MSENCKNLVVSNKSIILGLTIFIILLAVVTIIVPWVATPLQTMQIIVTVFGIAIAALGITIAVLPKKCVECKCAI